MNFFEELINITINYFLFYLLIKFFKKIYILNLTYIIIIYTCIISYFWFFYLQIFRFNKIYNNLFAIIG